jgi:hypothetical protein
MNFEQGYLRVSTLKYHVSQELNQIIYLQKIDYTKEPQIHVEDEIK